MAAGESDVDVDLDLDADTDVVFKDPAQVLSQKLCELPFICTFSKTSTSLADQGDQAELEYSRCGLTYCT